MNAARWDACNDPWDMLSWSPGDSSVRQQGFWAVACIRRIWDWVPANCHELVAAVEDSLERTDYLVGQVDRPKWEEVLGRESRSESHIKSAVRWLLWPGFCKSAVGAVADAIAEHETGFTGRANWPPEYRAVWRREQAAHASLLREVRSNPYRPISLNPSWHTSDVLLIAHGIYESRDYFAMPILADALQDAGCDNPDILGHCRNTSLTHVRGCWVVDLVLGKE
jgi:hypothetical protein